MYGNHDIVCQHCNRSIGVTQEDYMYRSLKDEEPKDLKCPHCGKEILNAYKVEGPPICYSVICQTMKILGTGCSICSWRGR